MKAFLAILTIALVAQVSLADLRSKREATDLLGALTEIVDEEAKMVEAVIKDMPQTDEYKEFKKNWQTYLDGYKKKNLNVLCVLKMQGLLGIFSENVPMYNASNAPAEAKELYKLFVKHGLEQHMASLQTKLGQLEKLDDSTATKMC